MQQTRSTHTLVHFIASYAACARGAGPHVSCLVRKMESDEEVMQACAAIVVADALLFTPCFIGETEEKKKEVGK